MVSKNIRSLAIAALWGLSLSDFSAAEEKAKVRFGAWEMQCQPAAGETPERCALTQIVKAEDKGAPI